MSGTIFMGLRAARKSANWADGELMGFDAEIRFVRSASEAVLEALSRLPDWAEERIVDRNNGRLMEPFDGGREGNQSPCTLRLSSYSNICRTACRIKPSVRLPEAQQTVIVTPGFALEQIIPSDEEHKIIDKFDQCD
jgi:hypothetical protein